MAFSKRARRIISVLWLASTVSGILGLVFHDAIASFVAKQVLAQRKFQCNEVRVHVPLRIPPAPIVLAPTKCGVTEGPLESVEFKAPLSISLDGLKPGLMTTDSLEIVMRPRPKPDVDMNVLGDITKLVGADEPAVELMLDSAILSRDNNPPLLARRAKIFRGAKPVSEFQELRVVSTREGMTVTSPKAHVDQAAILGDGVLRMKATPNSATVNVAFVNALKVKVDLEKIESAKPRAAFSIGEGSVQPQPDQAKVEGKKDEKKEEPKKPPAKNG